MNGRADVLVVVESAVVGSDDGDVNGGIRRGDGLVAEGTRLAEAFGGAVRAVTWEGGWPSWLEPVAAALADFVREAEPGVVLLPDSDAGRQLAPMIAHRLGTSALLGCSEAVVRGDALVFVKPVYGGHLEQEITFAPGFVQVVTLQATPSSVAAEVAAPGEAGAEPAAAGSSAPSERAVSFVEVVSVGVDGGLSGAGVAAVIPDGPTAATAAATVPPIRRLDLIPPDFRTVDLVHARRIVSAGAGSVGDALLGVVTELAELLEGSVGATRPVVDDGRLPKERLIGQTGKTVAPDLYLALGISGSPHHMAGVQGARTILSVNRDPVAPIFQLSDTGYVADLETLLPALVRRIKQWRDAGGQAAADAAPAAAGSASPATAAPAVGDTAAAAGPAGGGHA